MPLISRSKWGGGGFGLMKEHLDEWYCQICGEKQLDLYPSYMVPYDETQRDFARICTKCEAKANQRHAVIFWQVLSIVKGS